MHGRRLTAIIGAVGLCLMLGIGLRWATMPPAPTALRQQAPLKHDDSAFGSAYRDARWWQAQAVAQVAAAREARGNWDPEADEFETPTDRREHLAADRNGYLRSALEAAERAAGLARTSRDTYRAEALLAILSCQRGDHRTELRCAQRLVALEPRDPQSFLWLRRAARCNRLKALERRMDGLLAVRDTVASPGGPPHRSLTN